MKTELEHFPNLVTMFLTRAREQGAKPFLWHKHDGEWQAISYTEAARQVAALAESLKRLGLKPGDRVMLVSENRPEWLIADLGIMAAGCVTVPTYTTNTNRDHQHILANSGASAVIVSTQKLARMLIPAVLFSSDCQHIISIDDIITGQSPDVAQFHLWATSGDWPVMMSSIEMICWQSDENSTAGISILASFWVDTITAAAPELARICW